MRRVELKIFDPSAPTTGVFGVTFEPFDPIPPSNQFDALAQAAQSLTPQTGEQQPPFVASAAFGRRQPIRDRVRAGLISRVVAAAGASVSLDEVNEAIDEATSTRPLLDWLANGGLEKLIELIVSLLKLAA